MFVGDVRSFALSGALVTVGLASLTWQVVAARGVLSALNGNELVLGGVLSCWLVITALGAVIGSRLPRGRVASVLALVPAGIWAGLALQQAVLPAVTAVGQVVGPLDALWRAALCLLPPCIVLGSGFGLLSRVPSVDPSPSTSQRTASWAAGVYFWESLGTVLAGVLFHLWLYGLDTRWQAAVAGFPPWMAGVLVLVWSGSELYKSLKQKEFTGSLRPPRLSAGWVDLPAVALGAVALVWLCPVPALPGDSLLEPRMAGYSQDLSFNSRHGALSLVRRGDQRVVQVNRQPLFSNQDQRQTARRVHLALLSHPSPSRVLMLGGGLGGGLARALEHPLQRLDYVELDGAVVTLARRGRLDLSALSDPRVRLITGDGRALIRGKEAQYDAIIVGLPGPRSAQLNRFYTVEFFALVRRALRSGGLLSLALPGSDSYLGEPAARLHATVHRSLTRALGRVTAMPGSTTLLLAGRDGAADIQPVTLLKRFKNRHISNRFIDKVTIMRAAIPFAREQYGRRLSEVRARTNTDLYPVAYLQAVLDWLARSRPETARWLTGASPSAGVALPWLLVGVLLVALLLSVCLVKKKNKIISVGYNGSGASSGAVGALAVALAGFCGLALELVLMLGCQLTRGVIYHEMGALLTALMVGLALGAKAGSWITSWNEKNKKGSIARVLGGCLLLCAAASAAVGLALLLGPDHPDTALPIYLVSAALCGLATGACYAPASVALSHSVDPRRAAARAYAWDLTGAAAGALIATLTIPLFGLPATVGLCAAVSIGSAMPLLVAGK